MLPETLLFDLDDTILRFSAGQPDAWRLALRECLSQRDDHDALLRAIRVASDDYWSDAGRAHLGRLDLYRARRDVAVRACAQFDVSVAVAHALADVMTDTKEAHVRPFDGAIEAVEELSRRGHRLALLTNGGALFQRRKLERFSLEQYFELVLVEGELGFGKPDPRVFQVALRHFRLEPHAAIMIGDNLEADIGGAQAVGLRTVWHDAYDVGLPERPSPQPDVVVRSVSELLSFPCVDNAAERSEDRPPGRAVRAGF